MSNVRVLEESELDWRIRDRDSRKIKSARIYALLLYAGDRHTYY